MLDPTQHAAARTPPKPATARRWRTRFGSWVRNYSPSRLAHDLAASGHPVTFAGIQHWIAGRNLPRPEHLRAVVRISRGALTHEDVYRHRDEVSRSTHGRSTSPARRAGIAGSLLGPSAA